MSDLFEPSEEQKASWEDWSVVILTPSADYEVQGKFAQSVANMIAYSWMHGLKVYQWGRTERMVVDWARNDLARRAKSYINTYTGKKFTHLLWLDDDHTFNPDMAVKLASNGDKDMVSAVYFGRTEPLPVIYLRDNNHDQKKHLKYYPLVFFPQKLFQCDACGFGALLMKRDVLDRVPEPWFTIDHRGGEDIAFCEKARDYGVKVYADGEYMLGHIGEPGIITSENYKRHLEANKEKYSDMIKVELGG